MKKKSASQSAFFNLRVLIGLCVILSGACLALFAAIHSGAAPLLLPQGNKAKPASRHLNTLLNLKCSLLGLTARIHQLGIDKQDNMLAGLS